MKEFGIEELRDKDVIFSYDRTDAGTLFFVKLFWKEVCTYVGDVWVECSIC